MLRRILRPIFQSGPKFRSRGCRIPAQKVLIRRQAGLLPGWFGANQRSADISSLQIEEEHGRGEPAGEMQEWKQKEVQLTKCGLQVRQADELRPQMQVELEIAKPMTYLRRIGPCCACWSATLPFRPASRAGHPSRRLRGREEPVQPQERTCPAKPRIGVVRAHLWLRAKARRQASPAAAS